MGLHGLRGIQVELNVISVLMTDVCFQLVVHLVFWVFLTGRQRRAWFARGPRGEGSEGAAVGSWCFYSFHHHILKVAFVS